MNKKKGRQCKGKTGKPPQQAHPNKGNSNSQKSYGKGLNLIGY